jgi:hypothetical protein
MADKSFFRVRVKESCPYPAIMVKDLGKVTKAWQLRKGDASDYAAYSNLEVQSMIKEGNTFVPAPDAASVAESESNGTGGSSSSSPALASQEDKTASRQSAEKSSTELTGFPEMNVEQLKSFLTEHGVSAGELRGAVKADLIIRAEAILSHQFQEQLIN